MGKLHLKRTPEEEAEHKQRKKRRKEHKRSTTRNYPESSSVRPNVSSTSRKWASDDEDDDTDVYGPPPPPPANAPTSKGNADTEYCSSKPDYDAIRAELEEQRFRERLFGAYDDDERLDSLEARLNDYAHVPDRWQSEPARKHRRLGPDDEDEFLQTDPQHLDDEEYAEWIRLGMYRKTHRDEYEEQQREKARKKDRKAKEKAAKEGAKRLEKAMEEDRKRRKEEKESMRWGAAKEVYESRWSGLLRRDTMAPEQIASSGKDGNEEGWIGTNLRFEDIPWPVLAAYPNTKKRRREAEASSSAGALSLDAFTSDAISRFVLTSTSNTGPSPASDTEQDKKERREKLRDAMLRFHPDKFEGRVMSRVRAGDKERVREAVGQVARVLNGLMS